MATINGITLEQELGGSWGGAYGDERLFQWWDNGRVFTQPQQVRLHQFQEMLRADGKAASIEQILTLPLRGAPWQITPGRRDSGEHEFITAALTGAAVDGGMTTPLQLVIAQMTGACVNRASFHEKVFTLDDRQRVVYGRLAYRPPETCWISHDPTTWQFNGFRQKYRRDASIEIADIPAQKSVVYVHGQHLDPVNGISDMEAVYRCFESKLKIRWLWYSFLENQAMPKAVATHSTNDPQGARKFAEQVATLKGAGVLGILPDQRIDTFEPHGNAAATFLSALEYLDQEMSRSVLAGFLDLTSGRPGSTRGSFALSRDLSDLFMQGRDAVLKEMAVTIREQIIRPLVTLNFGAAASIPGFEFAGLTENAGQEAVTLLQALATAATPSPTLPREFTDLLTVKVAGQLGLDVDRVNQALTARGGSSPAGQIMAGADAAARLLQAAGVTPPAPPSGPPVAG